MSTPKPMIVASLFPEIQQELMALLKSLSNEDWQKATVCSGWNVKDVTLHLLGGEIGNLSRRRDGVEPDATIDNWEQLVQFINEWNQSWVTASRRISPRLLIDLLELTGSQMCAFFDSLDPFALGDPVSWVGEDPAPVWLDLAREYTERWHHQQHIRDAVGRPGLKQAKYLNPVLDTFMRALPRTYEAVEAKEQTCIRVTISGEAGGDWSILREKGAWKLYRGAPEKPSAAVSVDEDIAWRLFTRGIDQKLAIKKMIFKGDQDLGKKILGMISIIA